MTEQPIPDRRHAPPETIRLLEEEASVGIRDVTTGRIRVSTSVETFDEIARADLQSDAVEITRVAVNREVVGALPQTRIEDDVTIVPVFEEVLVVEKHLMLKEELHIRRRTTRETVEMPVTLRRQTAEIVRLEPDLEPDHK